MSEGLNIIVCIKQVPATTEVEIDPETGTLKREGIESVINPFDEYAIEESIRLKEKYGGIVKVVTMGPPMAEQALRDAIAMGCDQAILITDRVFAGADTWATSLTLARCIDKLKPYDIVLCGLKTTDGDTGQTGPELAEHLGIPHICYVNRILGIDNGVMRVTRALDDGVETLESNLPLLLTVTKEINHPRLATLKGRLLAKRAEIKKFTLKEIGGDPKEYGLSGSFTRVIKVFTPSPPVSGEVMEVDPEIAAQKIFEKLVEIKVI
ncbi:electron transfer flavoprotein subunit beta/FixA family protein [Candidatus Bathyarchaeota archaeon]|nr:electron transfer flavoprotein subunit beta/FixA family protein [Candidatus Bathyarchaeota archaeon]MBS7630951.1 electron transfer flavoprotein subunit beta/FixA family protein [Candidatus Bathyarchaeota archaeon]